MLQCALGCAGEQQVGGEAACGIPVGLGCAVSAAGMGKGDRAGAVLGGVNSQMDAETSIVDRLRWREVRASRLSLSLSLSVCVCVCVGLCIHAVSVRGCV